MSGTDAAAELKGRLSDATVDASAIAALLDGLTHAERVAATRALNRGEQRNLYSGVDGFRPVSLADLVPASTDDLTPVRHFGKNTLPVFTHFEKRFCRPNGNDRQKPERLFGFNFQTMAPVTGPGYFVAHDDTSRSEVLVDYREVPDAKPDDWPQIAINERGLSRFVYGFMVDTLRGVSEHVTIGSAARKGKDLGSWFILCREPS
jgi:hypothetical protein